MRMRSSMKTCIVLLFAFQIIECKNVISVIRLSIEVFVTNPTNYWGWLINLLYIILFFCVETDNYKKVLKSRKHRKGFVEHQQKKCVMTQIMRKTLIEKNNLFIRK